jgi:hypothetical protein
MVRMRLWADIPTDKAASGLEVEVPLPAHVSRAHCEVDQPGAAALAGWEFSEKTHLLRFRFKKIPGELWRSAWLSLAGELATSAASPAHHKHTRHSC